MSDFLILLFIVLFCIIHTFAVWWICDRRYRALMGYCDTLQETVNEFGEILKELDERTEA